MIDAMLYWLYLKIRAHLRSVNNTDITDIRYDGLFMYGRGDEYKYPYPEVELRDGR
jgi:hypothetical protein